MLPHVTYLINSILTTSSFLFFWKQAKVIPVGKSCNPKLTLDFRQISILPIMSKVAEKVIKMQITTFLSNLTFEQRIEQKLLF